MIHSHIQNSKKISETFFLWNPTYHSPVFFFLGIHMESWAVLYYITHLLKGGLLFFTIGRDFYIWTGFETFIQFWLDLAGLLWNMFSPAMRRKCSWWCCPCRSSPMWLTSSWRSLSREKQVGIFKTSAQKWLTLSFQLTISGRSCLCWLIWSAVEPSSCLWSGPSGTSRWAGQVLKAIVGHWAVTTVARVCSLSRVRIFLEV